MLNTSRYIHTVCYLRPVQVCGRLWRAFYRPSPDLAPPPALRQHFSAWCKPIGKTPSFVAPNRFRFLNTEHDVLSVSDWNNPEWPKLWLYNLHYFDYINAVNISEDRSNMYCSLMIRWIEENPPGKGNGWESYPLSIRIVNWIKWALTGNLLPHKVVKSLAIQIRYLMKRMEFHLLGNHLFANAKALVFAGLFFEGKEADTWGIRGLRILSRELHEQILDDGGHFELSPMYHSIILEDLLDLCNVMRCYSKTLAGWDNISHNSQRFTFHPQGTLFELSTFVEAAERMMVWLKIMCHPDNQIALFNDAAFEIASCPSELSSYAERLGINEQTVKRTIEILSKQKRILNISFGSINVTYLKSSGCIRVENGPMTMLLDVAPVGPAYLPGHAHADTLSFEMSFHGKRVIVNSGTSLYGENNERLRQRGTSAHNTVMINREDSSEVWGNFRVARRAKPFGFDIQEAIDGCRIVCSHDGYQHLKGKPIHQREWYFKENSIEIRDIIKGSFKEVEARLYIHPDIAVVSNNGCNSYLPILEKSKKNLSYQHGALILPENYILEWTLQKGHGCLINTTYHPEFGMSYPSKCLQMFFTGSENIINLSW
jgi:uncharacterized heparinase superfamily protein